MQNSTPDVHQQFIQAKRQNTKTTIAFACAICDDRKIFTSSSSLYEHAKSSHQEHVPSGEDDEALRNWRKWFESESARKRTTNDSQPRAPVLNKANRAQPEPPPTKRPLSSPDPLPPTRTLSGLDALKISTPRGSDDVTMRDASDLDDRQTPDLPRKRLATADKVSNGSASSYRERSPDNVPRRSNARPISAPSGARPETPRGNDGFDASRPAVEKRQLWTAGQTTSSPRAKVDPSNVASIQARKNRQQAPRLPSDNPASVQSATAKLRNSDQQRTSNSDHQHNVQSPKRTVRGPQEDAYALLRQPETRPISQEQLVAEVKGIYAGLVMVEARCIEVDQKHTSAGQGDSKGKSKLNNEQWQALIALHRTLLHEHHDFFLASQHPSASIALRRLASKYAMPARMWRHGIHSFLELLRHRLPASLDHMLAFIYLAYSMMALLYETVPAFEDTWIECLGDLARYRMAIEDDDHRDREVWTGVARHWYSKASNKAPTTGRLYHHLAILARPNALQQLFYYSKSLCCEVPFTSARESILTLFDNVFNLPGHVQQQSPSLESAFVKVHGLLFLGKDDGDDLEVFNATVEECLGLVDSHIGRVTRKFMEQGYYIATSNCVAMLGFASKDSILMKAIDSNPPNSDQDSKVEKDSVLAMASFRRTEKLFNRTFEIVLKRIGDPNVLTYIHVTLVYILYLSTYSEAMKLIQAELPWGLLAEMLNTFKSSWESNPARIEANTFPLPEKDDIRPLPEDYAMRGLLWAAPYFPEDWFTSSKIDEDERYREAASMIDVRKERISWLAHKVSRKVQSLIYTRTGFDSLADSTAPSPSKPVDLQPEVKTDPELQAESEIETQLPIKIEREIKVESGILDDAEIKALDSRIPTNASATTMGSVERKQTWETATESEAEKDVPSSRGSAAVNLTHD